ncbi:MAG: hypothetical protein LBG19_11615 [Prevotellaceae bacterium]|nr:hypothetical protein [Prevotellaceae bacterium]
MKKLYLLLLLLPLFFYSCEKSGSDTDNQYVNNWIYSQMSTYYLWNENLPSKSSLDFNRNPDDFFYSLLYKYKQLDGDRFSWIQDNYIDLLNSLQGVTNYDIGFEYIGYNDGGTNILAQVAYVKPDTHAEQLGIKRGDVFSKVNGTQLTTSNWRSIFNSATAKISFKRSGADIGEKTITLSQNYSEDPVYFDAVYTKGANKIGYLVYNFFAADAGNNSYAYDKKLNQVFGRFKDAGITHLVLDFRYNNGGSMNSATLLGSMIVPNLNVNNVYTKLEYNTLYKNYLITKYGDNVLIDKFRDKVVNGVAINNVGNNLQGLYILTGNWTASASELVINNLEPYMPGKIHLIGVATAGKNVGSTSFYKENDSRNKWGMQPIILKYANRDGFSDFTSGLVPDVVEKDNNLTKLELGDENELMLSIALSIINGTYSPSSALRQSMDINLEPIGASIEKRAWANQVIVDLDHLKLNK